MDRKRSFYKKVARTEGTGMGTFHTIVDLLAGIPSNASPNIISSPLIFFDPLMSDSSLFTCLVDIISTVSWQAWKHLQPFSHLVYRQCLSALMKAFRVSNVARKDHPTLAPALKHAPEILRPDNALLRQSYLLVLLGPLRSRAGTFLLTSTCVVLFTTFVNLECVIVTSTYALKFRCSR